MVSLAPAELEISNGTIADDSDNEPLVSRIKKGAAPRKRVAQIEDDSDSEDNVPLAQRHVPKADPTKVAKPSASSKPAVTKATPVVKASPANTKNATSKAKTTPAKRPSEAKDEKVTKKAKVEPKEAKTPAKVEPKKEKQAPKVEPKDEKPSSSSRKRVLDQKNAGTSSSKKPKVEDSDNSSNDAENDEEEEEDDEEYDDEDEIPIKKRFSSVRTRMSSVTQAKTSTSAGKKVTTKKTVDTKTVTKKTGSGGSKVWWTTLVHNGVIFPPAYQPHGVKMLYNGKPVDLTPEQEEVATMFAVMKDTDYAAKEVFRKNFWTDWKALLGAKHVIKKLELCDFTPIYDWHLQEKEKKKQMTTEEKKQAKEEKAKAEEKYTWATVDGVKEKVGNFRVEPPGLFRGRGEHPKMGKLKKRIFPEDITINIGKDAPIPECPMPGHKWGHVKHDNSVSWLAYWNDPINVKEFKYVFLHQSSSLKAQSDKEKYEKARKLKDYIDDIRKKYTKDFSTTDATKRQIAVATYLIDRLALRAGNEKDDDEADTVGCCSLKVEHVDCIAPKSVAFDFLGKDSIRYFNTVEVEEKVYAAIKDFKKGKKAGDDLFDKLDTSKLNAHLKEFMPGLTAKVFRTYNASITLDSQILNTVGSNVNEKYADYLRANKEVAILCNHQRSVSKTHGAQMERLEGKMAELKALREEIAKDLERAKKGKPLTKDKDGKAKRNQSPEQLEKKLEQTDKKIEKMELDMRTKDDLKTVALGTSKINYMDPRITVAWCKRNEVPIEKVFNKSLLGKFAWAMDVEPDFRF